MKMLAMAAALIGLASPAFAQQPASADSLTAKVVVSRQVTREVVVTHRVAPSGPVLRSPATNSGGVGGAIGGYYINGTTRADNSPLPGEPQPR